MIDVKCVYDKFYDGIQADNVNIIGENVETNSTGDGKFSFSLIQYMDSNLTDAAGPDDKTALGSDLYFQLAMSNPIPDLAYSIVGEYNL